MTRGRRATSDEVKALKKDPTSRRAALAQKPAAAPRRSMSATYTPTFLRRKLEKLIYARVVDDLVSRRIARAADLDGYGRWATYLSRWITLNRKLKPGAEAYETESKHGKMLRKHPHFAAMIDLERVMMALEDRLGLNPAARQNIIRGIAALAGSQFAGDLFTEDERTNSQPGEMPAQSDQNAAEQPPAPPPERSPLGFLDTGSRLPN